MSAFTAPAHNFERGISRTHLEDHSLLLKTGGRRTCGPPPHGSSASAPAIAVLVLLLLAVVACCSCRRACCASESRGGDWRAAEDGLLVNAVPIAPEAVADSTVVRQATLYVQGEAGK